MMGTLFYDPLASPPSLPGMAPGNVALQTGSLRSAGPAEVPPRRRTRAVTDEKALRAASLLKVSSDLERLSRQRRQG
jgi:hypothetical protein